MRIRAELCHVDTLRCVVRVEAWDNDQCIGSCLGEASSAEDAEDRAIVDAVIRMAAALGLQTLAEGVETEGQLAFLRHQGCQAVQGFLFSRPLTAQAFAEFVLAQVAATSAAAPLSAYAL